MTASAAVSEQVKLNSEIVEFLARYAFVECRENRHGGPRGWMLLHDNWIVKTDHHGIPIWTKTYQCQTCKVKRIKRRTRRRKLETRYDYSEATGYLAEGFRVTPSDVEQWEIDQQEARASRRRTPKRRRAS